MTHRIGLSSVTLRSDIVALLRKENLNLYRNQQGLKKGIEKSVPFFMPGIGENEDGKEKSESNQDKWSQRQ